MHPVIMERETNAVTSTGPGKDAKASGLFGDMAVQRAKAIFWRNRFLVLGIVALSILAALLLTLMATRYYTATGSVEIEEQAQKVLESEVAKNSTPADLFTFLQTQVDILESRYLAEQVVRRLDLAQKPDLVTRLRLDDEVLPAAGPQLANTLAERLQEQLTVTLPRNSQIVEVSYSSPDARLSADVANAFLDSYAESNLLRRAESTSYAREFLETQLAEAQQELEDGERAALAYARQAGLLDTSNSAGAGNGEATGPATLSITTSDLVQLNQALNAARQERIDAEQKWRTASGVPVLSLPQVQGNLAIQRLQEQRAVAQAEYSELRERYTDEYPTVMQVKERVSEIESQIGRIARDIRSSIRLEYTSAQRVESALDGRVRALRGETLTEQDRSVEYNILRRKADTSRQVYDSLLQRLREVSQESQLVSNNISVLDRAAPPLEPSSPRPLLNLVLGTIAGLLLAAVATVVREQIDSKIREPRQIEDWFDLPVLGVVPRAEKGSRPREQAMQPRSALSEAYQSLANTVRLNCGSGGLIVVTSSRAAEGKTLTSYALAQNFLRMGSRVLLIDADLRRGRLDSMFERETEQGLSEVLSGQVAWRDAVNDTSLPFIAAGQRPADPALLLSSEALNAMLDEVLKDYDFVFLDGPPVLGLADAPILANMADTLLYVVESSLTKRSEVQTGLRRLGLAGKRPLGTIMTKFDAAAAGYGEEYGYTYYGYGEGESGLAARS